MQLFFVLAIFAIVTCWFYFDKRNKALMHVLQEKLNEALLKTEMLASELALKEKIQTAPGNIREDLKKQIDTLYIVNELGRKLTSSLNLELTFHHLHTTLNSMMDAGVTELCVYDENGNRKMLTSFDGGKSYENPFSDWCYQNNREVILSHAARDYARYVFSPLQLAGQEVNSLICFPVHDNGRIAGTLCIMSYREESFDDFHGAMVKLLLGYVAVALDNAMRHDELNRTRIRAEQGEKFKEQFLANMSHEIRTPINAVTGMTRLLLDKQPRTDQMKYLESIRNASDSLLVIVNDILDLAKIEAGKIELERIDFSVRQVAAHVQELMNYKAEEKGLMLETVTDEKLPPVLVGDPNRLTQVLINLAANAVKFTPKGKVTLRIYPANDSVATAGDQPTIPIVFEVSDTGIGMTPEQQSRLFSDYAQAGADTARKYGGTGLGLSISHRLVKLQGGNLEVKSREGKGSAFYFTLNFAISPHAEVRQTAFVAGPELLAALRGKSVLLADDNEYNRIVVGETLHMKAEMLVDEAADGAAAVEMASRKRYDLILMDLVMPGLDGYEAFKQIRQLPSPNNLAPVVALTANVVQSEIARCQEAGMKGFIPKPFRESELFAGIAAGLGLKAVSVKTISLPPAAARGKYVDLGYLEEFTGGDTVRMQRHVNLFFSTIPTLTGKISASLAAGDRESLRIAAHSIKSPLRAAGVQKAVELAEYLESQAKGNVSMDELQPVASELEKVCKAAMEELKQV